MITGGLVYSNDALTSAWGSTVWRGGNGGVRVGGMVKVGLERGLEGGCYEGWCIVATRYLQYLLKGGVADAVPTGTEKAHCS